MKEVADQKKEFFRYQDKIEIYKEQSEKEPFYAMACLAGQDTNEAWELRELFLKNLDKQGLSDQEKDGLRGVSQGLAGVNSTKAWETRRLLVDMAPESTARGLAGMDSPESWELRQYIEDNYFDKEGVAQGLGESLSGLDNNNAWRLREKILKVNPESVLEGLAGLSCKRAWDLRYEYLNDCPLFVAASLIGLNNDESNQLRKKILAIKNQSEFGSPIKGALGSFMSLDTDEAWSLREEYFKEEPFGVGTSLAGIESPRKYIFIAKIIQRIKDREEELDNDMGKIIEDKLLTKLRKGLLQGLHSNYTLEAVKMNRIK